MKNDLRNRMYAYVRASSIDQNEDRRIVEMEKLRIPKENIYMDKQSGKKRQQKQRGFDSEDLKYRFRMILAK